MLKIVMLEDDSNLREIMVECVNKVILDNKLNANVIFDSGNFDEMNLFIDTNKADLYILDIDLQDNDTNKNGVTLGRVINYKSKLSFILYITGSKFNMSDLFEVKAYNCLTKPFNMDHLERMILKIYDEFVEMDKDTDYTINVCCNDDKTYMIKCSNIVYVEKEGNNCTIHLYDSKIIKTKMTLQHIMTICNDKLIQTHKSFLCNSKYIHTTDKKNNKITMETGETVLIGGVYKDNIYD